METTIGLVNPEMVFVMSLPAGNFKKVFLVTCDRIKRFGVWG